MRTSGKAHEPLAVGILVALLGVTHGCSCIREKPPEVNIADVMSGIRDTYPAGALVLFKVDGTRGIVTSVCTPEIYVKCQQCGFECPRQRIFFSGSKPTYSKSDTPCGHYRSWYYNCRAEPMLTVKVPGKTMDSRSKSEGDVSALWGAGGAEWKSESTSQTPSYIELYVSPCEVERIPE